ncbi:TIGR03960 family B12-binding radical SAM protein [Synechococcus sp. JA-2-3B'a(2-13)]|uniref:TIGR03960 family B12-binding radical SAM protein n=1 Tax=Synechococcus sp. (strain JA-2-3B'a(2-13)) TaxID=321332 RepID=UPI000069503E|nr:TIGR03960 family B12-binding radical SAM protein [Synechococcus sp. JA-2-3B'a(2-13)]ABD02778.1 radical SAM domain protein [Synechococcus sp. JA-2-3B'a(2-13)]
MLSPATAQTDLSPIDLDCLLTPEIQRPARYLGKEFGAVHRPWDSARVRWVLSYPELYEVGASNLGHLILYNILNAQPDQLCDRTYLPGPDLAARLRQLGIPLFAVESRRPLRAFHIIGFSLAYELGGTNILEMLDLAGIPLKWWERQPFTPEECPLIFAGGPTATSNPEPFADFFDFFVFGDGEEVLPEIGQVLAGSLSKPRREVLLELAQVPGVYVPQFYEGIPPRPIVPGVPERIRRRVALPQPQYSVGLVPLVETVHDRLVMEVRRGCTRGCRFCQPGMLTRPARDVAPEAVVEAVVQGLRKTGYNEFSLSSLSCSDYLSLPAVGAELHNRLLREHIALSLPSQRVDRFDEQIAAIMKGSRRSGLTFAPEAGTQRLRDIINKGLTDADLIRGIRTAVQEGWDKIKLYFMIGLPGETDADVLGIARTVEMLQRECAALGRKRVEFTLTLSNFTPKPHTPFQWHRVDYADVQRKQALLQKELRRLRGVKAHFTDIRFSILEDFIGKGDRSLGQMIERAWRAGAGMDAWWESIDTAYAAWVRAYCGEEVDPAADPVALCAHLPIRELGLEDPLPWDHIDTGIDKKWLQKDYRRALEALTVEDCSFEGCSACGICGPGFGHNIVIPPPPVPPLQSKPTPTPDPLEPEPPAQRFRITYGKIGDLRWLGHLDLMRLWERACRRAGLPLAFSGGYHPMPRLANANALPIGQEGYGEILDLELLDRPEGPLTPEKLRALLSEQLPPEIPIQAVQEISLRDPSATAAVYAAEYQLTVSCELPKAVHGSGTESSWPAWVTQILDAQEIWIEKTSKSGKSSPFNARALLYYLEFQGLTPEGSACLLYRGSCRNDGAYLRPTHLVQMAESLGLPHWTLQTAKRLRLLWENPLADPD